MLNVPNGKRILPIRSIANTFVSLLMASLFVAGCGSQTATLVVISESEYTYELFELPITESAYFDGDSPALYVRCFDEGAAVSDDEFGLFLLMLSEASPSASLEGQTVLSFPRSNFLIDQLEWDGPGRDLKMDGIGRSFITGSDETKMVEVHFTISEFQPDNVDSVDDLLAVVPPPLLSVISHPKFNDSRSTKSDF